MSGEAATQPSVRLPPLREGRLPKLMGAALGCRLQAGVLPESDVIMMMDGGREGASSQVTTCRKLIIKSTDFVRPWRSTELAHGISEGT